MGAKLILLVGVAGIAYYAYRQASVYDPNVFPYSKAQVEAMLSTGRSTYEGYARNKVEIWSEGVSTRGVMLQRQADGYDAESCEAVITPIDAKQTRVEADCSKKAGGASDAISDTTAQIRAVPFQEHILATMNRRPFNAMMMSNKQTALIMKNMPAMQREALRRQDEMQEMMDQAEANSH